MRLNIIVALSLLLSSCTGCGPENDGEGNSTKKTTDVTQTNPTPEGVEIADHPDSPTDEMVQNIITHLDTFLTSMSRGDFGTHLELMYPAIFFQDSLFEKTEEQMTSWWDKGFRNIAISFNVTRISPLVSLEDDVICVVWFDSHFDVVFTDAFTGKPENYGNMIKEKYGEVTYDATNRVWHADGQQKMYAVSPKDKVDFRFLNETYVRSPELQNLIPYDKFMELRDFEYD